MNTEKSRKEIISEYLKKLGISADLRGYAYLRYAIELVIDDSSVMKAACSKVYPAVAKEFGTSPTGAERAIRHAIENSMLHGNMDLIQKIFLDSINSDKDKPTNSQFIATLADYLVLKGECLHH